jgi:membrane protein YdbS with pleckstrin-like domain
MADPRRYLLPSERPVIQVRRHWGVLAADTLQSLGLLIAGIFVIRVGGGQNFIRMLAIYFTVFVVIRWAWIIGDWYVERFIVTDKRVLLVTGIVTRKVAIMPLVKVTDLTFNRSALGQMLGYGEFVVESAGQDQALSKISFIPKPEKLYIQVSELLFGGDKGSPALPSPAEREAELEAGARALRRRRRLWDNWRRRRTGPPVTREEPLGGGLDDLLARRDTLLAEREGRLRRDRGYPPTDESPTTELPRIHDPRRDRSDDDMYEAPRDPPRRPPFPRWGTDEPPEPPHAPPVDPADD